MNRGEVKLRVLFIEDECIEASYSVLFTDPDDKEELQDVITNLLYGLIMNKEEMFEGALVEVDIQDKDDLYVCTYGPLPQEVIEWIREGVPETLH